MDSGRPQQLGNRKIQIKKGLDLPMRGEPDQNVTDPKEPGTVALLGVDYVGMKPHFEVSVGETVKLGHPLFTDKGNPRVRYTSPGSGTVTAIHRGEKRKLLSVIIRLQREKAVTFPWYKEHELPNLDREKVIDLLLESGLWTSLRSRPFSKVADPGTAPHSLFVNAMDTNPLAPSMQKALEGKQRDFSNGLTILSRLAEEKIFLCKAPGDSPHAQMDSLHSVEFSGPHPAGNVGTHIHFLDPVGRNKVVWHIGAQDVVAVGKLFTQGRLDVERVVSLAGPSVMTPRLVRTRIGASLEDITSGELKEGKQRVISGSVLSGHRAEHATAFLGRYHQQITVIPDRGKKEFLGWFTPGADLYSIKNVVLSRFFRKRRCFFSTSMNGEERAIYPIGCYEKVMPLQILPTHLLKALAVDDIEEVVDLGGLELDEEDLALCTFVCPSKIDHGKALRRNLTSIEKEG